MIVRIMSESQYRIDEKYAAVAEETLDTFAERFGGNRRCSLALTRARSVLAEWRGNYKQALPCMRETLAQAVSLDLPVEVWQTEATLACLLLKCG